MASIELIYHGNNRENEAEIGETTIMTREYKQRIKKVIKETVINMIVLLIVVLISTSVDYYANLKLALEYYKEDQYLYVSLTLGFLFVPSLLVNYCYIFIVCRGGVERLEIYPYNLIVGIPVLSPVILLCLAIYHGLYFLYYYKGENQCKERNNADKLHYDKANSLKFLLCNLWAIETAVKNYPQIILQIYIYLTQSSLQREALRFMQLGSIAASCCSISWAQTSWYDSIYGGPNIWLTLFISPFWRLSQILPFVFALAAYFEIVGLVAFSVISWKFLFDTTAIFLPINVYGNNLIELDRYIQFSWLIYVTVTALSAGHCYCVRFTYTRFLLYFARDYIVNLLMIWTWYYNTTNNTEWFYLPIVWGVTTVTFLAIPLACIHHKCSNRLSKIEKFDELDCSEDKVTLRKKRNPDTYHTIPHYDIDGGTNIFD